jgi:hypothetical protein
MDERRNNQKKQMNKIVLILLLIIFSSCEQDYCWQCVYTEYEEISACSTTMAIDTFSICYKTEDWISKFEDTYSYSICDDSTILICSKIE